ncbi:MAG: methyltransferase domain-containing protein [Sulfurovum sp.]|nr:methyltransferase domain-containing protein [Sulfurovum sp.]
MQEKDYAKNTFDEVANNYDDIPFFKISAKHLIGMFGKEQEEGLQVLDVACGTGNVALTGAKEMPDSQFRGIDISEGMLAKARANAKDEKLENVDFLLQDITTLDTETKYDVITCAYALFFLPEAHKVLSTLHKSLKPQGKVIFTSFLPKAFNPSVEILLPLLEAYGSKAAKAYAMDKWENLKHVEDIERLCAMAEIKNFDIETRKIRYGMDIDEWWALMNNTGFKGMLMELTSEDYETVKEKYYASMLAHADMDGEIELNADSYFVTVS